VLSALVSLASTQDHEGARRLLEILKVDAAYSGEALARWCDEQGGWPLEVVRKHADAEASSCRLVGGWWGALSLG
jgi:hypothetical protein